MSYGLFVQRAWRQAAAPPFLLQPACHAESRAPGGAQDAAPQADLRGMSVRIAPVLALLGGLLVAGCSSVSVVDPLAERVVRAHPASSKAVVTVRQLPQASPTPSTGSVPVTADLLAFGFASITAQPGADPAQRRLQAARAAKLDAYRSLAEQLYGVRFTSDSVVVDSRVREDHIRTRIEGVIAGAEIVALEPLGNDTYQATVKLPAAQAALLQRRSP